MRLSRSVILLLSQSIAAALLVGCQSPPPPAPAPKPPAVATPDQVGAVQLDLTKFAPNAHVGQVQMVSASDGILAVTGINVNDVKVGDVITILDADHNMIANGTVNSTQVENSINVVVVQYDAVQGASRGPIKGDLAITKLISN